MRILLSAFLLVFGLGLALPLGAATPSREETIQRLEDYFNNIHTLQADFTQTLSDGNVRRGELFISRPGKMRLEYAPPVKDLLISDGLFVHAWDASAKTSSSVPIGTSLADIILRDNLKLSGDVKVTDIRYYPNMLEVSLVQKESPQTGTLTLEFEDNPLRLRNWRVIDAQGVETRVALSNEQTEVKIPSRLFVFRAPNFGR
jgi:outer membrane lipoprotein-sorting protein